MNLKRKESYLHLLMVHYRQRLCLEKSKTSEAPFSLLAFAICFRTLSKTPVTCLSLSKLEPRNFRDWKCGC